MKFEKIDYFEFFKNIYSNNPSKIKELKNLINEYENIKCKHCGENKKENLVYRCRSKTSVNPKDYTYRYQNLCKKCKSKHPAILAFNKNRIKRLKVDQEYKNESNIRSRISNLRKMGADTSKLSYEYMKKLLESDIYCPISYKFINDKEQRFVFDHNHKYKYLRKLVLNRVNAGLGSFKDNPNILLKAATYLDERSNGLNFQTLISKNKLKYEDIAKKLTKKNGSIKREPGAFRSFNSRNPQIINFNAIHFNLLREVHKVCEICGNTELQNRNLSVDHKGEFVRGILCIECNRGLGNFNEDINEIMRARHYLLIEHQKFLKEKKNIDLKIEVISTNWDLDIVEIYELWKKNINQTDIFNPS